MIYARPLFKTTYREVPMSQRSLSFRGDTTVRLVITDALVNTKTVKRTVHVGKRRA